MKQKIFPLLLVTILSLITTGQVYSQLQTINVGTRSNDDSGDPIRTAYQKTNNNFTYINNLKANLASPAFTGIPTVPIPATTADSTTQIANTAWVKQVVSELDIASSFADLTGNATDNASLNTALNGKVPVTRTVNGHALSSNVTIVNTDISEDATHRWATDAEKTTWNAKVSTSRTINTTSPLTGGGDLSSDRTIAIQNSAADGSTKGAASFNASDFDASSGNISLDYTNGPQQKLANSAGLRSALSDETGTGNAVFSDNPTLTNLVLPSGTTATTQTEADNSTKVSTTAYADGKISKTLTRNRQTTNYTLVLSDNLKLVEANSASTITITVPANSTVAFPADQTQISIGRYGVGSVNIVAAGGVTIRSRSSLLGIADQYTMVTLIKIGTDEWYLIGNLQ